jgi:hypothetical protein
MIAATDSRLKMLVVRAGSDLAIGMHTEWRRAERNRVNTAES